MYLHNTRIPDVLEIGGGPHPDLPYNAPGRAGEEGYLLRLLLAEGAHLHEIVL